MRHNFSLGKEYLRKARMIAKSRKGGNAGSPWIRLGGCRINGLWLFERFMSG